MLNLNINTGFFGDSRFFELRFFFDDSFLLDDDRLLEGQFLFSVSFAFLEDHGLVAVLATVIALVSLLLIDGGFEMSYL